MQLYFVPARTDNYRTDKLNEPLNMHIRAEPTLDHGKRTVKTSLFSCHWNWLLFPIASSADTAIIATLTSFPFSYSFYSLFRMENFHLNFFSDFV
jgi:hypothetical protein